MKAPPFGSSEAEARLVRLVVRWRACGQGVPQICALLRQADERHPGTGRRIDAALVRSILARARLAASESDPAGLTPALTSR